MFEHERKLWLLRSNIDRFNKLLKTETDEAKRKTIGELLMEAEYQLGLVQGRSEAAATTKGAVDVSVRVRGSRLKAEECRTIAENMKGEAARLSMLQLARDYEALADSWEKADRRGGGRSNQEAS